MSPNERDVSCLLVERNAATIPAQVVPGDGNYDPVFTLHTVGVNILTIACTVGGTGPLTGLQLTFSASNGGTHVVALQDADFSTATDTLLRSLGLSTPTNITAPGNFQFTVDLLGAVAEAKLWAKSALGATVACDVIARRQAQP